MDYKTSYLVIEGDKYTFENELNKASEEGYIWCGNINTTIYQGGVFYSQLMSKTETVV